MSKKLYEIKNGEVTITEIDEEEMPESSEYVNYLCISDMFEGIEPAKKDDYQVSVIGAFLTFFKANRQIGKGKTDKYVRFINDLFESLIESKDLNDLCSIDNKESFYNELIKGYEKVCKERNLESKELDNNPEFISTIARMITRSFIEENFNKLLKKGGVKGKSMYDNLQIGSKHLYEYSQSRVYKDSKLSAYITTLYKEYMKRVLVDTTGHLCSSCKWKYVTECPKVSSLIHDGRTLDEEVFNYITDARQLITINEDAKVGKKVITDYCIVTGCRKYPTFESRSEAEKKAKFEKTRNLAHEFSKNFYRK